MIFFCTLGVCDGIMIVWPRYQQGDMKCHVFTYFILEKETLFHMTFGQQLTGQLCDDLFL